MARKIIYTPEQEAEIAKIADKIEFLENKIKEKLLTKVEREKYKKLITQLKNRQKDIKEQAKNSM